MSGLWTPSGEHRPDPAESAPPAGGGRGGGDGGGGDGGPEEAAVAEELRRVRAELAATPVVDLIANHGVGLWQLAVLHLVPEGEESPHLEDAALAIDALAGIVEGLGDRLGRHAVPLRDALAQLRVAYVQVQEREDEREREDDEDDT
ncbi:MAG TPA: hypothetical protein VI462_12210 [Acidimicrobiia bacterium]